MMIDTEQVLDFAFEKFNLGLYEEAFELAKRVQTILPTHGDALYLLGLLAQRKNNHTQACDYLTVATKLYPQKSAYQLALTETLIALKNYHKVDEIYSRLPDSNELTLKKGYFERIKGNLKEAKQLFKSLLNGPFKSQALYALSLMESKKNKEKYLKEAYEIEKNSLYAEALVSLYLDQKKYDKIKVYQNEVQNNFLLAKIFMSQKKYEASEEKLNLFLKENPYHYGAWYFLGQVHSLLQDPQKAEFDFNQALSLNKDFFEARQYLARLLMVQGRFFDALEHYQVLIKENPEDKEVLMAMALLTEKTGDYEETLGLCFRLLTLGQKKIAPMIKRNIKNLAKTNKDLAQKFLKGWQKIDPKNPSLKKILILLIFYFSLTFSIPLLAQFSSDDSSWQIAWENKMAEAGDPVSQYNVAEMFEMGKKVPKDLGKAIKYYEKSAYQGHLPAALKLATILSQTGKYQDLNKSLQWYKYVAEQGEVQAQFYLAEYYQNPANKDDEQAKFYLQKALKQTFPNESDLTKVSPQYADLIKKTERKIK